MTFQGPGNPHDLDEAPSEHQMLLHRKHYSTTAKMLHTDAFQSHLSFVLYFLTYLSPIPHLLAVASFKRAKKESHSEL